MKDELLKVLNIKLKYINDNIDALNRMNSNLERENEGLDYVRSVLSLLEVSDGEYSVYNFSKLEKENFEKILNELNNEVRDKFETENCNYDGLIYLINGINNGISLKLTKDQIDAVEFMIDAIVDLRMSYLARIDGVLLARASLEISDLEELTNIKEKYDGIIEKLETNNYVDETEEIMDAINYARIPNEKIIEILSYLLQYNSEIYVQKKEELPVTQKDEVEVSEKEGELDLSKPFVVTEEETVEIPIFDENESLGNLGFDNVNYLNNEASDIDEVSIEENELQEEQDEEMLPEETTSNELEDEMSEFSLPEIDDEDVGSMIDEDFRDLVEDDEVNNDFSVGVENEDNEEESDYSSLEEIPSVPLNDEELSYEDFDEQDEDDIKKIFDEYKVKYNDLSEENKKLLLEGNVENYKNVLGTLKDKEILNIYEKSLDLLVNTLVYSNVNIIENVLDIIGKELSVDKEDREVTTNIVVSALPSVFVKEPYGNYETFVKNIELFKKMGIDLINLFDFSREMFIMNHEQMVRNKEIAKSYDLIINDKNAKYLLVLPNVEEKIDYYIEAIATDTMKNGTGKTFDGSEYIKLYPNKLNTVTDTTIKRLRYSSENGKKLFGAKENSLAGEITNLKVDVLNMSDEYLRNYFNNEFDMISRDEELRYEKLIQEETDYDLELDETLEILNQYLNGLRYNIEGVNISRNKLIRNYNILIKNGVDKTNALIFAACHNAVITKEEYQKVKNTLSNIGGR